MLLDGEGLCPCQIDHAIIGKQKSYHISYVYEAKMVVLEILVSPYYGSAARDGTFLVARL